MTTHSPWREQSPSGSPPTADRATPGTVIGGRYELITAIGHGGMGTVWRANDTQLRRDVAVKEVILPPTMPDHEKDALRERTMREARAAAGLSHPSVVQVYDVVTDADRPWIVMELLEARSLADMVIDDGPLPPRAVAKIGIAMLGALEVAHAAGVLHRDVKPANVLISDDGRCVLTDFGVARLPTESKLTTPGMVLGSPHFISPERAVGGDFGPPSDLFSLGVTLYTAVEGGPPFDRGDPFETMRAVVEEQPRPARLAGPLKPVLWGLLEKEPERRWTVAQARTALRELLNGSLAPTRVTAAEGRDPSDTDPHAVIRRPVTTRPVTPRPATTAPATSRTGAVGGRAMLDPEEPLTDQLARLRREAGVDDDIRLTPEDTQSNPAVRRNNRPSTAAGRPSWAGTAERREHVGRRRAPSVTSQVIDAITAPRNRPRVIVVAGLVVILALVVVAAWTFGGDSATPSTQPTAQVSAEPTPTGPLIETQEFRERGIALNVPKGWTRSGAGSYVDFQDPASARWVRINIEGTGATAMKFLQNAESGLKTPSRCASPYTRVELREVELAGIPGAELEYTCGTGDGKRHGIWRAVIRNGAAYHFYLTTLDSQFEESRAIFDEMVRSFQFTTA